MEAVRLALYFTVIAVAFTLPAPWMVGMQAAIGGVGLGMWLQRFLEGRLERLEARARRRKCLPE